MKTKTKIIIIVLALIIALIFLLLAIFLAPDTTEPAPAEEATQEEIQQSEEELTEDPQEEIVPYFDSNTQNDFVPLSDGELEQRQKQTAAKVLAISFVERIGSYSNESDFENFEELNPFMTSKMQVWAKGYVEDQRSVADQNQDYFGVTTKVLSTEFLSFDEEDGTATILLNTQKIEYKGAEKDSNVITQKAEANMVRLEGTWYVDGVYWK